MRLKYEHASGPLHNLSCVLNAGENAMEVTSPLWVRNWPHGVVRGESSGFEYKSFVPEGHAFAPGDGRVMSNRRCEVLKRVQTWLQGVVPVERECFHVIHPAERGQLPI